MQEYKMQEEMKVTLLPCSCGQFIHSAHFVRHSLRIHSYYSFNASLLPLSVHSIPSLTSEPRRKRSSVHFAFRTYALCRSASRHDLQSLNSFLIVPGTWNSTPFFGTLSSVASLSLARPHRGPGTVSSPATPEPKQTAGKLKALESQLVKEVKVVQVVIVGLKDGLTGAFYGSQGKTCTLNRLTTLTIWTYWTICPRSKK